MSYVQAMAISAQSGRPGVKLVLAPGAAFGFLKAKVFMQSLVLFFVSRWVSLVVAPCIFSNKVS